MLKKYTAEKQRTFELTDSERDDQHVLVMYSDYVDLAEMQTRTLTDLNAQIEDCTVNYNQRVILIARVDALEAALRAIRDFRTEENEWDGVEVCMPEMRKIAQDALLPGAVERLTARGSQSQREVKP